MMLNLILKKNLIYIITLVVLIPQLAFANLTIINSSTISVSATVGMEAPYVPPVNPPQTGGGGGGGGGGGENNEKPINNIETVVNFSGMAYPMSRVYVLKDGNIVASTIADPSSKFSVSLSGLLTNTYTFSLYSEDANLRKSLSFSFPIFITSGTTVNIGNIFLSPTIDTDKSEVKKGDNLVIFGQSTPKSEITISIHSDPEYFYKVGSNEMGGYLYNLDTSVLELGKHQTKSKSILGNEASSFNAPISFVVGTETKIKESKACGSVRGDLNCDSRVNLVDFSIMAYWYKKINPPLLVDLNSDGKISLVDFSIMAFNWTG